MIGEDQLNKLMASDFWNYISTIDWGNGVKSASAIKRTNLKNIPPYKADIYKELARGYAKELMDKVLDLSFSKGYTRWEIFAACYEVIGYGKTEYQQALSNPLTLERIVDTIESADTDNLFINCIPSEDDYYFQMNE